MCYSKVFHSLSTPHLNMISFDTADMKLPQPNTLNKSFGGRPDIARNISTRVSTVDFLEGQGEHYIVLTSFTLKPCTIMFHLPLDFIPPFPPAHAPPSCTHSVIWAQCGSWFVRGLKWPPQVKLRKPSPGCGLGTGLGVDLRGLSGCWLEEIGVLIDYE